MNRIIYPRIHFIIAADEPVAVIFRRGPSKWTQLIHWNLNDNKFTFGQWFKGRVYERRSDLTPNGKYLVYFVNKFNKQTLEDKEYTTNWTAISKPPYFTALALFPKGDCWHGGGIFKDNVTLFLNHNSEASKPHPKHKPEGITIIPNDDARGEDDPIFSMRLLKYNWEIVQKWDVKYFGFNQFYKTLNPEIREKINIKTKEKLFLERSLNFLTYKEEFYYQNAFNDKIKLYDVNWAEWDNLGRLVIAKKGKMYISNINERNINIENMEELINLNYSKPTLIKPNEWASNW